MYASGTTPVEAVVVEGGDGTTGVVVTLPEEVVEAIEEAAPITAENSEAVALAEIHSETAIELATIEADASVARIEARNEGDEAWQEATTHLRAEVAALGEAVSATALVVEQLVAQLNPEVLSLETETGETLTLSEEPTAILIPETPLETSSETETEVPARSEEEKPVARRRHRMI